RAHAVAEMPAPVLATWVARRAVPALERATWAARARTAPAPDHATWAARRRTAAAAAHGPARPGAAAAARVRAHPAVAAACRAVAAAAAGVVDSEDIMMRAKTWILAALFTAPLALGAPADQKTFKTPEAAVQALVKAAQAKDSQALIGLFGAIGKPLIDSGDEVADKNARDAFLARYKAKKSLDKSVADKATLNVGEDD